MHCTHGDTGESGLEGARFWIMRPSVLTGAVGMDDKAIEDKVTGLVKDAAQ